MEVQQLQQEFLGAIVAGDARMAELVALEAVSEGLPLASLYVDVITPALHEVGRLWQRGELTIADEHLATSLVAGVMGMVGRSATQLPRRTRERVLLAAVENEGHVVGLRMLQDLFEGAGFDVRYLGAAVPLQALQDIVARLHPRVVGLSASVGAPAWATQRAVELIAAHHPDIALLVGGSGVPDSIQHDPRVHYAPDAREALARLEALVERDDAAGAAA